MQPCFKKYGNNPYLTAVGSVYGGMHAAFIQLNAESWNDHGESPEENGDSVLYWLVYNNWGYLDHK